MCDPIQCVGNDRMLTVENDRIFQIAGIGVWPFISSLEENVTLLTN